MMETKKVVPVEPLTAAIARGWCHPMNSHKEMDTNLVFAIADEVTKWLVAALRAEVERLTKENKFLNAENLELEATQQACKSAERRLAVAVGALERVREMAARPKCICGTPTGTAAIQACAIKALQEVK